MKKVNLVVLILAFALVGCSGKGTSTPTPHTLGPGNPLVSVKGIDHLDLKAEEFKEKAPAIQDEDLAQRIWLGESSLPDSEIEILVDGQKHESTTGSLQDALLELTAGTHTVKVSRKDARGTSERISLSIASDTKVFFCFWGNVQEDRVAYGHRIIDGKVDDQNGFQTAEFVLNPGESITLQTFVF